MIENSSYQVSDFRPPWQEAWEARRPLGAQREGRWGWEWMSGWTEADRHREGRAPCGFEAGWPGGREERLIACVLWGGRLPRLGLAAVGIGFRPGPVGLRDSRNAGPRAWRQASAISHISDLPAQIWKFEEAQPALPDCKET